jgi:hypothetical protein
MSPRKLFLASAAACAAAVALTPASALGFGSVNGFGQRSEHERVTRLALQCAGGEQAPSCFQPTSLDNVAGVKNTWGAVGAADNFLQHRTGSIFAPVTGDEAFWHCDDADYLQPASNGGKAYKQSRAKAMNALRECLQWGKVMLYDGPGTPGASVFDFTDLPQATPFWGALSVAGKLLDAKGNVGVDDVGSCNFNGVQLVLGRGKCNVLEPWGYVLHMAEDFYSHTNWADKADPGKALGIGNAPGLGMGDPAPFLDLRRPLPADGDVPADFTGGCFVFPDLPLVSSCINRVRHNDEGSTAGINKDKALIDTATGVVGDPQTLRGKITVGGVSNVQRAVNDAVAEARRQWVVLRAELVQRFGVAKGSKMACVLTMDTVKVCDTRNLVEVVDTAGQPRGAKGAMARAAAAGADPVAVGRSLLGQLSDADRVSVLTFDSSSGDQDPDPFVAPDDAAFDAADRGDRAGDPATTTKGGVDDAGDPTVVTQPDAPDPAPLPADQFPQEGQHETPDLAEQGSDLAIPAQPAPKGDTIPSEPKITAQRPDAGTAAADALAGATALLANDDAPAGQRGVVLVTYRLGDVDQLVDRIGDLADSGASVSLVRFGGDVPDRVVAAIERANGTVLALPADASRSAGSISRAVAGAGLTRLTDVFGPDQGTTLVDGGAPVTGVTDRGSDTHQIGPLDGDATLVVRTDEPLKVVVRDQEHGTGRTLTARPGDPASVSLDQGGDYVVQVAGPNGRGYTAAVS